MCAGESLPLIVRTHRNPELPEGEECQGLSGRRTSAAAAIRFACSSKGIVFGEPFGNHSKFQVVIRMTALSPSDEASETNARINAITSKKVRESMCGAGRRGLSHSQRGAASDDDRVKYWEIIADNLSKAGWSWGCISAVDSQGRTTWIVDARRDNGRCFVGRAEEKLTAFLELERIAHNARQRVQTVSIL